MPVTCKHLPDVDTLRERFVYDPLTGEVKRRKGKGKEKPVGYLTTNGYLRVKVNGTHYRLHRVVWKMYYGEEVPEGLEIDHSNNDKTDNRISNLRVVTSKENQNNRRPRRPGQLPAGIHWDADKSRWAVRVKNKRYGSYKTQEEAIVKLMEVSTSGE